MSRIIRCSLPFTQNFFSTAERFVYVVGEVGSPMPVKIGKAANPVWRLSDLQCGNFRRLELRAVWAFKERPLALVLERKLQAYFKQKHLALEWYETTVDDIIEAIGVVSETLR